MRTLFLSTLLLAFLSAGLFGNNADPLKVSSYKLNNGLTVYLNQDPTATKVQGMVVVKGGAKRDPKDATGIAHYFEHIMFKGTNEIGTIDYSKEKPYLDSIKQKYDELAVTEDPEQRRNIQKEINRISLRAVEYAIPNEFDRIINGMGGTGLNAGTSYEYIVYYNAFPSNQIEKWLEVYSHRFLNPVFRLFQSELETVYEEKNMYADNFISSFFETFSKSFYKEYPYGQQTILGKAEHLKNPSLSQMQAYFDTYYVANNMALILTGNFNEDEVKPIIEEKFSRLKQGETPEPIQLKESPFKGRETVRGRYTPVKVGMLGFRTIAKGHPHETSLKIIEGLLSNSSSTGLLDQLKNDNELMMTGIMPDLHEEVGGHFFIVVPKVVGQSIKNAEKKVLNQLDKLKEGEFSDELFNAVKLNLIKNHQRSIENMNSRTYAIMDGFVYGTAWEDVLNFPEEVKKITKEQVIEIAKLYFSENYLAFHSKMGFPKKDKVEKPPYKAVQAKNTEAKSTYAKNLEEMEVSAEEPRFIEVNKDVFYTDLKENLHLYVNPNPVNEVFTLNLKYNIGTYSFIRLNKASELIEYCGIGEETYKEFYNELQQLGADLHAYSDLGSFTISISGLEENFVPTIELLAKFLKNPSSNTKHVKKLWQNAKAESKLESSDPATIADALLEYALYEDKSNYLNRLSLKDIKRTKSYELLTDFKKALMFETSIHYSGKKTIKEVSGILQTKFYIPKELNKGRSPIEKPRKEYEENTIFFTNDKNAIQTQIYIVAEGEINDEAERNKIQAFNEYFGGGMSSLVFQEIREFRSLAYGTNGYYRPAFYKENPGYFKGYLSTQADKTIEALEVYTELINNMPEKPERIENIKESLIYSVNAKNPGFRYISNVVENWQKQGYQEDPRKKRLDYYKTINFDDIKSVYNNNLKGKKLLIVLVGDKKRIDFEKLSEFGKIIEIDKEDLFN